MEQSPDWRLLFEAGPGPSLVLDANLSIVAANDAYLRATQTQRGRVIGRGIFELLSDSPNHPLSKWARGLKASLKRVAATGAPDIMPPHRRVHRRPESEGGGVEERYWTAVNSPVKDSDGKISFIIYRIQDVTDFVRLRCQRLEACALVGNELGVVRHNEQRFHALVDLSAQIVWTADASGACAEQSPSWRAFTGRSCAPKKGGGWLDAVHPDDRDAVEPSWRRALEAGTSMKAEFRLLSKSGEWRWAVMRAAPLRGPAGNVKEWVCMISDVTETKRAELAIVSSERSQREFVANVSHDFRTPIAAIKGFAETLLTGALEEPQSRVDFTRTILRNADRLADLVEDVLLLSSLEAGKLDIRPEAIDLDRFLREYAEEIEPLVRRRRNELQLRVEAGTMIWADPRHLGKIIQNLVTNALKYNRRGGWVRLSAQKKDGKVLVSVKDPGIGIAPEHLPRVFERFFRVDKSRAQEKGDNGLGLSIVKRLVEIGGNKVWVNSAEGRGTTFHFTVDACPS